MMPSPAVMPTIPQAEGPEAALEGQAWVTAALVWAPAAAGAALH